MPTKKLAPICLGLFFLLLGFVTSARADTLTFNFESTSVSSGLSTLALTSGGLTMTLSRPGTTFAIVNGTLAAPLGFPASWGSRTLSPGADFGSAGSSRPFLANFSEDVTQVTMEVGDFGLNDVDLAALFGFQAFDATGALVDFDIQFIPFAPNLVSFKFITLTVNGGLMRSLAFAGGSTQSPNSVLYDNIVVTTVPEPVSMLLLGSGLTGLALKLRRRRRN